MQSTGRSSVTVWEHVGESQKFGDVGAPLTRDNNGGLSYLGGRLRSAEWPSSLTQYPFPAETKRFESDCHACIASRRATGELIVRSTSGKLVTARTAAGPLIDGRPPCQVRPDGPELAATTTSARQSQSTHAD